MVTGLDLFRQYFKNHTDKYILIGGTACDISMGQMGLEFRATKDLDIVLVVEAIDAEFATLFWQFIKKGRYQNMQKSTGKTLFYRFLAPEDKFFPYMLELFARKPDILDLAGENLLTPIPIEEASSLSAILMENTYYNFVVNGKAVADDVCFIPQEYLIPLKARAYLDLQRLKNSGSNVDSKDLKKHKNDIFRLYQILSMDLRVILPGSISDDMNRFLDAVASNPPDLKNLGIKNKSIDNILDNLKTIYSL